jgi:LysM repeat protein
MNHARTIIQTVFLLLISNFAIAQAPIYLEIGDCTKEMHYTHTNSSNYFGEFYDYHFALNDYETVVFETPKTGWKNIAFSQLSESQITNCGSASFDQKVNYEAVAKMQNGSQAVYMVKQMSNGYAVAKVVKTTYQFYLKDDGFLRVIEKDLSFDYNEGNSYDPGEELIQDGEGSFVFYTQQYERCYKKPIFMHVPTNFMEAATLEYALGVGLIRAYSDDMEKKLIAVNGQNVNFYLDAFCGIKEPLLVKNQVLEPINTEIEAVTTYNNSIYIDKEAAVYFENDNSYNTKGVEEVLPDDLNTITMLPELAAAAKKAEMDANRVVNQNIINTAKSATMAQAGMTQYIVKQGDTLYNISKRYNLTTLQIKRLNDLSSNTIEINQVLYLK